MVVLANSRASAPRSGKPSGVIIAHRDVLGARLPQILVSTAVVVLKVLSRKHFPSVL